MALPWMATELLAPGLLTGVAAGALIVVPVRLASGIGVAQEIRAKRAPDRFR